MTNTIIVRRDYLHYITKYNRYEKRHRNIPAHMSPCFRINEGDQVVIGECRPLSKTVRFNVLKVDIAAGSAKGIKLFNKVRAKSCFVVLWRMGVGVRSCGCGSARVCGLLCSCLLLAWRPLVLFLALSHFPPQTGIALHFHATTHPFPLLPTVLRRRLTL